VEKIHGFQGKNASSLRPSERHDIERQQSMRNSASKPAGMAAWILGLFLAAGCQTSAPNGDKVAAYITVEGRTVSEIRLATLGVFKEHGYQVKSAFGRDLVFEKQGSVASGVMYGDWGNPTVWQRVKVRLEEFKVDVNFVECSVYRVLSHGDRIMEEENEANVGSKKEMRELLAQIKAKLDAPPPAEGATPKSPTSHGNAPQ